MTDGAVQALAVSRLPAPGLNDVRAVLTGLVSAGAGSQECLPSDIVKDLLSCQPAATAGHWWEPLSGWKPSNTLAVVMFDVVGVRCLCAAGVRCCMRHQRGAAAMATVAAVDRRRPCRFVAPSWHACWRMRCCASLAVLVGTFWCWSCLGGTWHRSVGLQESGPSPAF